MALLAPTHAVAAGDLPPLRPVVGDLATGYKPCTAGEDRPFVSGPPVLNAKVYDQESAPGTGSYASAEFELWWEAPDGTEERREYKTPEQLSGTPQSWPTPDGIAADTVVSWRVRADDGGAVSSWSSDGDGSVCEFVIDDVRPSAPVVTSEQYPQEGWTDGVGVHGDFTFDSMSDDVVQYRYAFAGEPFRTVEPAERGGPVTVRHLPVRSGTSWVEVTAFDRAGNVSTTTRYGFAVAEGRSPAAAWKLADAPGTRQAAAESGPTARAGAGVTFGVAAPEGTATETAARLDGTGHGFLSPGAPVADTAKTFAVSGWVRPGRTDQDMTLASQDAGTAAGFTLGLDARTRGASYAFTVGGARVSGGAPETGEWAHLLGLFDAGTGKARLYVNGRETGTAADAVAQASSGAFQIGRAKGPSGYRDRWTGEVGDVRVYDRVVVPTEITELARQKARVRGHWSLENAQDGTSPELHGGAPLRLGTGADVYRLPTGGCDPWLDPFCDPGPVPLVGEGHLELDGQSGHAATDGPVVDTDDSFTVGVTVRLADSAPSRPMTVLSQGGANADAFKVRYLPSSGAWQLVMSHADAAGAARTAVGQSVPADGGEGQGHHLTVVYDDAADRISLYVDGRLGESVPAAFRDAWESPGGLQVGRARTEGGWGEYLHGSVDEVRAFAGVLSDTAIRQLSQGAEPNLG